MKTPMGSMPQRTSATHQVLFSLSSGHGNGGGRHLSSRTANYPLAKRTDARNFQTTGGIARRILQRPLLGRGFDVNDAAGTATRQHRRAVAVNVARLNGIPRPGTPRWMRCRSRWVKIRRPAIVALLHLPPEVVDVDQIGRRARLREIGDRTTQGGISANFHRTIVQGEQSRPRRCNAESGREADESQNTEPIYPRSI